MKLTILGIPQPKQSFRYTKKGIKYKPAGVQQNENNIRAQVKAQLPAGFKPFTGPVVVTRLWFVFPPLKTVKKADRIIIETGGHIPKTTKPDLTDNLSKGLYDAMEGVVYLNDSQVYSEDGKRKYYGAIPRIEIEIEGIE